MWLNDQRSICDRGRCKRTRRRRGRWEVRSVDRLSVNYWKVVSDEERRKEGNWGEERRWGWVVFHFYQLSSTLLKSQKLQKKWESECMLNQVKIKSRVDQTHKCNDNSLLRVLYTHIVFFKSILVCEGQISLYLMRGKYCMCIFISVCMFAQI